MPPRHTYAPLRKAEPSPGSSAHAVHKVLPLSPVLEADALHPIGAERASLRKPRPANLGLPQPAAYHNLLRGEDSIDFFLDEAHSVRPDKGVSIEDILTPHSARASLPTTPRTPLTPSKGGSWPTSLSTTLEFSAGKSIWS